MKNFYILLWGLLLGASAIGQETPVITMTTSLPVGSAISFRITNTPIEVDFGDGIKTLYNVFDITGTVKNSQVIKIYGTAITTLTCMDQQITGLDVSQCTTLKSLVCVRNELKELTVRNNHLLEELQCDQNQLNAMDITQNPALYKFSIGMNFLKELNITQNTMLKYFWCDNNYLTFKSLPANSFDWYVYYPQKPITVPKSIATQTELDLSSQYLINGNKTVYKWKEKRGTTLTQDVDYSISSGKTIFIKTPMDSVYCVMTNASFPELTIKTTNILVTAAATKKAQTITFDPIPAKKVGDPSFDLKATATSNLDVSFSSNNTDLISITGTTVTILKSGTVNITASQSGNGDWNAAEPVTQTLSISKKAQTINFEAIPAKKIKDAPFTLKASSSSNLPITFTSSDPMVASVNGSTVTILKAGTVTFTATQAGNEEWEPISTSQKLTISATTGINDEEEENLSIYPNPVTETLYIKGKWLENTNASIFNAIGTNVWSGNVTGQSMNVSQLPAGIYLLRISHKNEVKTIRFEKQ